MSPHPPGTPIAPPGWAHLEAAGVPVVPGTFGLFLFLCGGKTEGKSLQGSWRKQLPSWQCPLHSPAPALDSGQPRAPPTPPGQPGAGDSPSAVSPRPPWGWGHLPWCCRDLSPCWAWLCSSSRCGGRVLGKKTLSGHSSPAVYCTLSRFSPSPLAVPAGTAGSAGLGGHGHAATSVPQPTGDECWVVTATPA